MAVDYEVFKGLIEPAERVLGRIDEATRKIYWETLGGFGEDSLKLGVGQLIKTHAWFKFPTVAEFMDAVRDNPSDYNPAAFEPECPKCGRVGRAVVEYWVGDQTFTKEQFCDCPNGQRQRKARFEYYERKRLTALKERGIHLDEARHGR